MMMNMMVKIKMAITWTIFKLGSPDFPGHELCMQSGSQGPSNLHNSQLLDVRKFRKAIYSRLGNMTRQVILGVNLDLKIPLFLKRPGTPRT